MSAFLAIAAWEIRTSLRRISTWVYFLVFFALAHVTMLATAGAFDQVGVAIGSGGKVLATAPFALAALFPLLALFGVSITAALVGNAVHRDFEAGIDPLFFTTPVSKTAFLGGRFAGSMVVNTIVLLGIGIGAAAATVMPWVNDDKVGAFRLASYLMPYLTHILPNLLLTGALFFALAALTRQMLPNYVGGALLLVGYLLSANVLRDLGDKTLSSLVDPFGLRASAVITEYWSIAERNSQLVPFTGLLVWNRLLWVGVALAVLAIAFARFQFAHGATERRPKHRTVADPALARAALAPVRLHQLPPAAARFDFRARWIQYLSVTRRSFWRVVRNPYFVALLGGGLLYLVLAMNAAGQLFGTNTWPVTHQMVDVLAGSFGVFIVVIIAFYVGELVWAERDARIHQIHDATPVTNAVTLLGKLTAMIGVIAALLLVSMVAGILTQISKGYYRFEIGVYLASLGMQLVDLALIAVLAMAIHVVVNHKYVGHLAVILFFVASGLLSAFGLEHNLYAYTSDGGSTYSDMNGFGPFLWPFVIWKLYWGAFAVLLVVATLLLWVRGLETEPRWRAHLARLRFGRVPRAVAAISALAFIGLGGFVFYNTNILNTYRTSSERRHLRAERERLYKKYEHVPQPKVAATRVRVELYPERQDAIVTGAYVLRNETTSAIDTVHLAIPRGMDVRALRFDRPSSLVRDDSVHRWSMYRLGTPLAAGDSLTMTFELAHETRGFPNVVEETSIVGNGTFLSNSEFMPTIGYDARAEIADEDQRKKEKLPERPRMESPTAPDARDRNYVSSDADWIRFAATVCTDPGQTAITSGYLQREWSENGRRCFDFAMDSPILDLWAIQSARYAVRRDRWHDVAIEVYYHPTHAYNVARMIEAVKRSLDYYTTQFGPYQHRQLRIVEFPRYAQFAQSLPNTIPYSEDIGFIARVEGNDDIDYPFYVTAHEVAHQWWAHQVIGADAQGSTLLSETLAQYSALMVMEHEFGAASMRRFLEYELDRYLVGRATERRREMPISLGENQPYIHYNKGSLVMYALRDYLGEERTNTIVRDFLARWKFQGPPYPTSLDFVEAVRAATPDSLKYVIADLFDQITLYELKTDSTSGTKLPDGRWQVDLWLTTKKLRADSLGRETEVPMQDWIDIGVFARPPRGTKSPDRNGVPIHLAKHRLGSGAQHVRVVVDEEPLSAGVDPLHKLIDRYTKDNVLIVRRPLPVRGARPASAGPAPRPTRDSAAPPR